MGYTYSRAVTADVSSSGSARDTSATFGFRWVGGIDLGVVFRPTRNLFFSATPELSVAPSATGQEVEGAISYVARSTRVRFASMLSLGVLLGT